MIGYGAGDCKSISYSCDRKVISRLSWTPLLSRSYRRSILHINTFQFNCNYLAWFAFQCKGRSQRKRLKTSITNRRRSAHRAIPVSLIFFNSLTDQLAYPLKNGSRDSLTHISERARAQIFAWVFGDRDIIYSLQHKQPFLMFIISHSCDCFRPHVKRNRVISMR